jgi:hypothetical protein
MNPYNPVTERTLAAIWQRGFDCIATGETRPPYVSEAAIIAWLRGELAATR